MLPLNSGQLTFGWIISSSSGAVFSTSGTEMVSFCRSIITLSGTFLVLVKVLGTKLSASISSISNFRFSSFVDDSKLKLGAATGSLLTVTTSGLELRFLERDLDRGEGDELLLDVLLSEEERFLRCRDFL